MRRSLSSSSSSDGLRLEPGWKEAERGGTMEPWMHSGRDDMVRRRKYYGKKARKPMVSVSGMGLVEEVC